MLRPGRHTGHAVGSTARRARVIGHGTLATLLSAVWLAVGAPQTGAQAPIPPPQIKVSIQYAGRGKQSTIREFASATPTVVGLVLVNGQPPASTTVQVYEFVPGVGLRLVGTPQTDARGHFSLRLPPGGARIIGAVVQTAVSNKLYEEQRVPVLLRARPRHVRAGGKLHFSGQISGVHTRLLVVLQVDTGRRFRTFELAHGNATGAFTAVFRFSRIRAHYRFRAFVPQQNGFGYAHSASNTVKVRVS